MSRRWGRSRGVAADGRRTSQSPVTAFVFLALALAPGIGSPHASLVRSAPARRAVIVKAPDRVQLWFNERLEGQFSRLEVWDVAGRTGVDLNDVQVDPAEPKKLSVGLPPLPPGAYVVRFRVLSVDGHVVEAEFPFTVRAP
jgi:methionine-rich copper-binding protein CopC